ncbi:MAG: mandelate racemase/muconate lactonizing enzyme family protein [Nitrososphaerota archaeon]|nr:mandelate racemase/muconate lactonizing enzyme family protein [Nitrososphaerota archaeon]MDG7026156.1 mandelate racemase/muconate lactonizing enzyme family protein [Nitrososphaerota archaeon]
MKIRTVEVIHVRIPLRKPLRTSHLSQKDVDAVLVRLETDDGLQGVGEVTPILGYSAETAGSVDSVIKEQLVKVVMGEDPFRIGYIQHKMNGALAPGTYQEAKAAIEIALHDILGKALNVPVYQLLGGRYRESVPVVGWVGLDRPEAMAQQARQLLETKFRAIKVKIGGSQEDIVRVKSVMDAVGGEIEVRADANEAPVPDDILRKLDGFGLKWIEQPAPRDRLDKLAEISRRMDTPIMADESAENTNDVYRIASTRAADVVKLKVMRQGGLLETKKCLALLDAAGIQTTIGHGFNLTLGALGEAHVVLSSPEPVEISEIGGPFDKMTDEVAAEQVQIEDGMLVIPKGPGLGTSLSEPKIEKYLIERLKLSDNAA